MICYKDRTFCISENCTCHPDRKYTEQVQNDADLWWNAIDRVAGSGPVMVADLCNSIAPPPHELLEIEETMKMLDELEDNDGSQ